ncbi:MAG: ABC transporter permease [Bacteroidota bacterium]
MIRNYLKIAWRNLLKRKVFTAINILGLAIGVASCLTIGRYVTYELSYDRFHQKGDRIARIVLKAKIGDEIIEEATTPSPVASALVQDLPEVKSAARIRYVGEPKVTYKENSLRHGQFAFVDPDFFRIFTLPLLKGDTKTALEKPNSLIVTESQARRYFGNEDPIGKTLEIEGIGFYTTDGYMHNDGIYTVTGVMADLPKNSHFDYQLYASMSSNKGAAGQSWISGNYLTYVLLNTTSNLERLQDNLPEIVKKYMGEQLQQALGMSQEEFLSSGNRVGLYAEPLSAIHFSEVKSDHIKHGNSKTVYMFGAIALFMLVIACINFMNLSTAVARKRSREIGMRKVLGSKQRQLVFQFLAEALLASLAGTLIGLLLWALALPYFNNIANTEFKLLQIFSPSFLVVVGGLMVLVALMAGSYPAFFMSSFRPVTALKKRFVPSGSSAVRNALVVFQFIVSITLIIATLVVSNQMNYVLNKDVGYNREQMIVIRSAGHLGDDLKAFKEIVQQDARVLSASNSAFVPAGPSDQSINIVTTKHQIPQTLRTNTYHIDEAYIPTLGMEIVNGRNFSKDFGNERNNIIINQTAVKTFGFEGDPVGQTLSVSTDNKGGRQDLTIVGVVRDFHSRSLHEVIEPLIMDHNPYYGLIVRAQTQDIANLVQTIKTQWDALKSGETFEYAFLDELYQETYRKESNTKTILQFFAVLTILVACLGLFGLVTFTAEQRFKEIGVRKVLGSTVTQIVQLLAKDFLKWVVVALFIAFPLSYYLMNLWLEDFSYRIQIQWWVFLVAGLCTMAIAFVTISLKSIKAALMNPVKSLRTE